MLHRLVVTTVLALVTAPASALAYSCGVPTLVDPVKKAVCASVLLTGMDKQEDLQRKSLSARLARDARTIFVRDRRAFTDVRETCVADTRCLEATYRAQLRLYGKIEACLQRPGAKQTFCVSRTTQQHRQDLHKSL